LERNQHLASLVRADAQEEGVAAPEQPREEVVGGLTRQEILEKVDEVAEVETLTSALIREPLKIKKTTMQQLQEVLGLPYQVIYNKILPLLRAEGYQIERNE
jgi:hypothetical protein